MKKVYLKIYTECAWFYVKKPALRWDAWKQLIFSNAHNLCVDGASYVWIALIPRFLFKNDETSFRVLLPFHYCSVTCHRHMLWYHCTFIRIKSPKDSFGRVHHHLISVILHVHNSFNSRGEPAYVYQQAQRYLKQNLLASLTPSHAQPCKCLK